MDSESPSRHDVTRRLESRITRRELVDHSASAVIALSVFGVVASGCNDEPNDSNVKPKKGGRATLAGQ